MKEVMTATDQVLTKEQSYRRWQDGIYGNKLRAWRTVREWEASGFQGSVVLRTLLSIGGSGSCRYNLSPEEVGPIVDGWEALGIPTESIMVNEAAPDEIVLLQGEYLNDFYVVDNNLVWADFLYSREKRQMRDALKAAPERSRGLRTGLLLKMAMTPASHESWLRLLDEYPGHVLEVSVYDSCLGDVPGCNALVWEVRKY
jgi:hypothetical protein